MCVFEISTVCFPFLEFFDCKIITLFCKKQVFFDKNETHTFFYYFFCLSYCLLLF